MRRDDLGRRKSYNATTEAMLYLLGLFSHQVSVPTLIIKQASHKHLFSRLFFNVHL